MPTGRIDQVICFSYKNQQTGLHLIQPAKNIFDEI